MRISDWSSDVCSSDLIYLQRASDERVTDAQVETAYQDFLKENPPERQLKARHILVETEEAAKEVIVALDGGADFAERAKERSTGPSGTSEIGRTAGWERGCQYVEIPGGAETLQKTKKIPEGTH